ncbi:MAG: SGNH/GDSL hydrolase family protein [Smithella sp.]
MNKKIKSEIVLIVLGGILITAALLGNEWLLAKWLCPEGLFDNQTRINILITEIILFIMGSGIILFRKKEQTLNLSLLLITVIVLFTGAEIFFRNFLPQKTGISEHDRVFEYDSLLGWRMIPNKKAYFVSRHEFRTKISINSAGMRDKEYSIPKTVGKKRIAILGDSFTSSFGVYDNEAFAKIMEEKLLTGTEVLNFGVNGYGPTQELLLLQTKAIKYRPDLVIMVIYVGNDFDDIGGVSDWIDGYLRPKAVINAEGKLQFRGIPVPLSEKYIKLKRAKLRCEAPRSHFIDFIDKAIQRKKYSINFTPSEIRLCKKRYDNNTGDAFRLMGAIVNETNEYCRKKGSKFMVVVAPTIVQVFENRYWNEIKKKYDLKDNDYNLMQPNYVLSDICRNAGIPMVDLTPPLKSATESGNDTYYIRNQHWNKAGEQIAAETIARFIKEKNLF